MQVLPIFEVGCFIALLSFLGLLYFLYANRHRSESTGTGGSPNSKSCKDKKASSGDSNDKLIPGYEPATDGSGNIGDVAKAGSLTEFLIKLHKEFGPIACFWLKEVYIVSIASPDLYKQVVHLFDRPVVLFKNLEPLIGPGSVQFRNGSSGQQTRKLHDRSFAHGKLMEKLPMFQQIGEDLCSEWSRLAETEEHIPLSLQMSGLVMKALTRFAFGDYFKDDDALIAFRKDYDHVFWIMENYLVDGPLIPGSAEEKSFQEGIARLKKVVFEIIRQRQEAEIDPESKIFIDTLLDDYANEDMLFGDVISYLIAGSHTTGFYLFWALYHLCKHPDIQDRCYTEICEHYSGGPVTWETMKDMRYLQSVMSETQRFTPLAPYAARYCESEMQLGGYTLPPETPILMSLHTTMWDETLWPEPQTFDPDRFADRSKIPQYVFEPFSFGKRKCPGYRMSEVEVQIFLLLILKNFKVSLVPEQDPLGYKFGILTKPDAEAYVTVQKRESVN